MQVSYHYTDVQILPETNEERQNIINWAKSRGIYNSVSFEQHISNVKGQDWYGKLFFTLPFGTRYPDLLEYLNEVKK